MHQESASQHMLGEDRKGTPMEIACSMALRLAMSSSKPDTNVFRARPWPSSSLAVETCFSYAT